MPLAVDRSSVPASASSIEAMRGSGTAARSRQAPQTPTSASFALRAPARESALSEGGLVARSAYFAGGSAHRQELRMTPPGDRTEAQAKRFASTGSWASPLAPDGTSSISGAGAHTVQRAVAGPGRPLEPQFRRRFETDLGLDLGPVRVHTHPAASASARALGAKAYTIGSDIAFAPGAYQPASGSGRELLAHELAHVAQQTASGAPVLAAFPDVDFWDVVDVVSPVGGEIGRASGVTGSDVLEGAGRYVLGDTLWDVLSAFAGGFKEGLKSAPKQQLDRLSDKFDDFGISDAYDFIGGYTTGVFKGLWYELKDLFDAIRTLLGLPAALNDFLINTLPHLAARLKKAMAGPGGLSERFKKLSDAYNRNPAAVMEQAKKLLDAARAAVLAGIRKRGRGAAASFYKFLEEPWDEIGEDVGTITGRILLEVLLALGTDAIGNFIVDALKIAGRVATPVVEAAVDAVRALGRLAGQMAEWLEGLVRRLAGQGGELFDALRELVAGLRNLVSEIAAPELEAATAGGPKVPVPKGPTVLESRAVKPPPRTTTTTVADLKPKAPATVKTDAPHAPKPAKTAPPHEPAGGKPSPSRPAAGLPTVEEDLVVKRYARGLADLRERLGILRRVEAQIPRDEKALQRARAAYESTERELQAIEDEAALRTGDTELANHLNPLTEERSVLKTRGTAATTTGERIPAKAVEKAPKNLRGMDFAEIEKAIGRPPDFVSPASKQPGGGVAGGHQRLGWKFEDGSQLIIDDPRELGGRAASADRPHAELHGPKGERLDQQGIVVPERSISAHMTITDNTRALENHFAPARAGK
jgi:hypothetical protein